jgi:hypothetical protein
MKRVAVIIFSLCLLTALAAPVAAQAALPGIECYDQSKSCLIPCGGTNKETGEIIKPCEFRHVILLIRNLITYGIYISFPIAALGFAYAGWLYMSAHLLGKSSQISQAHEIFRKILTGYIIIIGAWLIVKAITSALLKDEFAQDFIAHLYKIYG